MKNVCIFIKTFTKILSFPFFSPKGTLCLIDKLIIYKIIIKENLMRLFVFTTNISHSCIQKQKICLF